MFSRACVILFTRGVCTQHALGQTSPTGQTLPGRHPLGRHPLWPTPPWQTPPGRHPPPDDHCSGRCASYWNAFLYLLKDDIMLWRSVMTSYLATKMVNILQIRPNSLFERLKQYIHSIHKTPLRFYRLFWLLSDCNLLINQRSCQLNQTLCNIIWVLSKLCLWNSSNSLRSKLCRGT